MPHASTDAPPHLAADPHTQTYAHEMKYLTQVRGLPEDDAKDVFQTFSRTALQHFGGNLVLNCVVYSSSDAQDLYGRLSQQTGGMVSANLITYELQCPWCSSVYPSKQGLLGVMHTTGASWQSCEWTAEH